MKKNKKIIRENIEETALSPLAYCVLIDANSILEKNRSMLSYMFPSTPPSEIKKWFRKLIYSENFSSYSEKLKAISERFSNNTNLKVLYKSLDALKTSPFAESERAQREADIQKIIGKISYYIKKRLSEEDSTIFEDLSSLINGVATVIASNIDSEIDSIMQSAPAPKKTEKPKTEIKISERLKNKFKKKIKEMVRTHFISKNYR